MEMSQNMKYLKKITFVLLRIHNNVYVNIFPPVSQKIFSQLPFYFLLHTYIKKFKLHFSHLPRTIDLIIFPCNFTFHTIFNKFRLTENFIRE